MHQAQRRPCLRGGRLVFERHGLEKRAEGEASPTHKLVLNEKARLLAFIGFLEIYSILENDSSFLTATAAMSKTLNKLLTQYRNAGKALDKLNSAKNLARQDHLAAASTALRSVDLGVFGLADQQRDIALEIDARLKVLRQSASSVLLEGLHQCFPTANQMKMLSDNPLVLYLHPLTLEVDFEQSKGTLLYAHEVIQTCPLVAEDIMAAHAAILTDIRETRIEASAFFDACKMAYDMVRIKEGLGIAERVDIVDLLLPLGWIWPKQGKKTLAALPRHILAYQLNRLRADNLQSHKGWRIELGAATGATTRNKSKVLFVPHAQTEGQYYLSICFRQG